MLWAVVGRPRILLPRTLWTGFDPDHREAVLAHELAHLARGDHWMRRFELVVLALYWWCPVAWIAVRELRRAEEACCDARVLGVVPDRAVAYAEALVRADRVVEVDGVGSAGVRRGRPGFRPETEGNDDPEFGRWTADQPVAVRGGIPRKAWRCCRLPRGLADDPRPAPELAAAEEDPPPPSNNIPLAVTWRTTSDPQFKAWAVGGQDAPAAVPPPPMAVRPRAETANLRDEVELLEAQMHTKEAHVRAAERGGWSRRRSAFDRIKKK